MYNYAMENTKGEKASDLDITSLAETVYEDLKRRLNSGDLRPGQFIDLSALGRELGMSRTPLRDAMIRLELEGFVTVYPRRGVMVFDISLTDIRDIYQIIGALESSVVERLTLRFRGSDADKMDGFRKRMEDNLAADDFDDYYAANLAFHDVYLDLSDNADLVRTVRTLKERLYDFPRRNQYVKEWELDSTAEHAEIVARLRAGDFKAAAAYVKDVHWNFEVQERYIRTYYFASGGQAR
jgi:DNA-binding GntR family transcriptional regulator